MSGFAARDPDFAARVRASFARQGYMTLIGASLGDIAPGLVEVVLPYHDGVSQQHGLFHGGAIGAVADTAGGYSAFTLIDAATTMVTVEYKLNLVAPGRGERLVARGRVIRPGRTLTVTRIDVVAVAGGRETLCATAQQTMIALANTSDGCAAD